ncbi:hypothetical protein [Paenibacillus sp. FSL H7-0331]|uniref:hypothetical protein n=1 Tax=Paenibacillus sp. FSL H7-0331 TaxID=1920421 RepID=UPI00096C5AD7|nr:hypothetical protein [Paenibacillus sp. FSL H7-0331]OMF16343.1 hypothetical protein BK127_13070 [Paenibacillus sp. FSL H7-0331]
MGKIVGGWLVTTFGYFLTLFAMVTLYSILFKQPADYNWDLSGTFIGVPLIIVPYLLAGLYVKRSFVKKRSGALWVSIIPVISERLLIYLIGYLLILVGGDGSINGITTMMFIRGEAAPYYTYTYMICGVFSIWVCMITASTQHKAELGH